MKVYLRVRSDRGLSWLTQISAEKQMDNLNFRCQEVAIKDLKERLRKVGVAEREVRRAAISQRDFYLGAPLVSVVGERGQRTVI